MAVTLRQFIENLTKSGLFVADELSAFQEGLPPEKRPQDAQGLARELVRAKRLTKYQAEAVYRGKTKGLVFGEYTILEQIGAGGMGQVFKARHRTMERVVALKMLPPKATNSPEAVKRFHREVRTAAKLTHPNIVIAYDASEHEGIHYLVMECVDGKDLADIVVEHGPLPVEQAVDCIIQAARGLEYSHKQGVVHRDIKPGNLILDREGTVKVLDMGLARMFEGEEGGGPDRLTSSGQVMGTCDYMAPEQAEDTHAADHRADIYSLGCTLYRLLTGEAPFKGETLIQVLLAHREADIPSLCAVRPEVPAELDAAYQKMMAKNPEDRHRSMGEAIAALETCLTPEPVGGAAESSTDSALRTFLENLPQTGVASRHKPKVKREETRVGQVEEETHGGAVQRAEPGMRQKRWMLVGMGGGAIALVLLVVLVMVLSGGADQEPGLPNEVAQVRKESDEEPTSPTTEKPQESLATLIIQWSQQERVGATLDMDGANQDIAALGDGAGRLRVPVSPGDHAVWIARRGYQPIERRFTVKAGQELIMKPAWKAFAAELSATEAEQESLQPEPSMEPAAVVQDQPPSESDEPSPDEAETATAEPSPPTTAGIDPALKRKQELEEKYAKAMKPIEAKVAEWDFVGAIEASRQIRFEEQDLAKRLDLRRDELLRLERLKERLIAKVKATKPPLKKSDLKIRGVGGEVTDADENGITATLLSGKTESLPWNDLGEDTTSRLLQLVIDKSSAEDWLAGGLLAFTTGDTALAERLLDQAASKGIDVSPYLMDLAATSFSRAVALSEEKKFKEAVNALEHLQEKYGAMPWFESNKSRFDLALAAAKEGVFQTEAEQLYQEAVGLFEKKELFDLRDVVEKLKEEYAESLAVKNGERKPAFAELETAVAELGTKIVVRLDGKGDFTSIQAAIDSAHRHSLIEIQDNGPYEEQIDIPVTKEGLTIRGRNGYFPIVASTEPMRRAGVDLVAIGAPNTTLERLILLHAAPPDRTLRALSVQAAHFSLHSTFVFMQTGDEGFLTGNGTDSQIEDCLIATNLRLEGHDLLTNCLVLDQKLYAQFGEYEVRSCTILGNVNILDPCVVLDSILGTISCDPERSQVEHCNAFGSRGFTRKPGKGCFSIAPQFLDPANLDYRLAPTSPCKGKASDGGDLGVRYTPEMMEMVQIALRLRAQGIIDF